MFELRNISTTLNRMPMVAVFVPFAMGIWFSESVVVPLWLCLAIAVVTLGGALRSEGWWRNIFVTLLFASAGAALHGTRSVELTPYHRSEEFWLRIDAPSQQRGQASCTSAYVVRSSSPAVEGRHIMLWSNEHICFEGGDRLHTHLSLRPFSPKREAYANLMHHRGYIGSATLYDFDDYRPATHRPLHTSAVQHLRKALPDDGATAVVLAMTTGERSAITPALRHDYSCCGASHILAVSGMHVGILFLLVNLLIFPLAALPRGELIGSAVAIACIWSFVAMCNFSPSAVRAAAMFSALQLSLLRGGGYVSGNILATVALVMLAVDSHLLFDPSFQLSALAVMGIIFWGVPIYMRLRCGVRLVNILTASVVVGAVSTLVTLPVVSATFGIISVVGVALNPIVVLLAYPIVLCGIVGVAIPPAATLAHLSAEALNTLVARCAALPWSHVEVRLAPTWVAVIYAVMVVATLILWSYKPRRAVKLIKIS